MRTMYRLLIIYPRFTSTKIGIYDNEKCIIEETLQHETDELNPLPRIMDPFVFGKKSILDTLHEKGMNLTKLNAVVGRGDMRNLNPSGTYEINETLLKDLSTAGPGKQTSYLGAVMAYKIACQLNIPAYLVDWVDGKEGGDAASSTNKIHLVPGKYELQALAEGALRVLRGEEKARVYSHKGIVRNIDFKRGVRDVNE